MKDLDMSWSIRQVLPKDAPALRKIRLELVKENPKTFGILYATERRKSLKHFEDEIRKYSTPNSAIFFLEASGKVVGMAIVRRYDAKDPYTGYLSSMGILKKYQGCGLGKELLKHRLEWIRKNTKFKRVLMIIVDGNEKMVKLAHNLGFSEISHSSFYGVPNTKFELKL